MANAGKIAKYIGLSASAGAIIGGVLYGKFHTPTIVASPLLDFDELTGKNGMEDIHLSAHRGLSAIAPENTLPSYEAAGKQGGYYSIECDAYCSTDDVWVIMHDNDVRKMTDQTGKMTDFSYDELVKMRFDNGSNYKDFDDLHVCTLKEYIAVCKKYGCRPQIEIKDGRLEKMDDFYNLLKEEGILESCIIISFNYKALCYLRKLDENLEIWYLVHFLSKKNVKRCVDNNFGVNFRAQSYSKDQSDIKRVHEAGILASCWTVDNGDLLNKMINAGVKYITTNCITPSKEV